MEPDQIERGILRVIVPQKREAETPHDVDALFALPLDDFTGARNALARRLKQDGDTDASERVRTLAKPSVAAWAVNQVARREPEAVRSLLNVAARLRSAQERSLQGERVADELRTAQAEERDVIRNIAQRAGDVLRDAGRPASAATLERVSSLVRAAAVADPARTALREGRLVGNEELSGFDAFAGLEVPETRRRTARAGDDLADRRRRKREAEQRRKKLTKQVRDLNARAETAEREAEKARRAADAAEVEAAERRRDADAAAAELAELEQSG